MKPKNDREYLDSTTLSYRSNQVARLLHLLDPTLSTNEALAAKVARVLTRIQNSASEMQTLLHILIKSTHPTAKTTKMLPLSLLNTAEGHPILVELKNGETYNGHLEKCDNWMNIRLHEVICTSPDGNRFWRLPEIYI
ncbi:hypothetical protein HDV00_006987, partial [Rhizophlyctis rosea]